MEPQNGFDMEWQRLMNIQLPQQNPNAPNTPFERFKAKQPARFHELSPQHQLDVFNTFQTLMRRLARRQNVTFTPQGDKEQFLMAFISALRHIDYGKHDILITSENDGICTYR